MMGRLLYKKISLVIMSHGRQSQLPLLATLLFVVSIKGIMPDAHDLASKKPLRLLARICSVPLLVPERKSRILRVVSISRI